MTGALGIPSLEGVDSRPDMHPSTISSSNPLTWTASEQFGAPPAATGG